MAHSSELELLQAGYEHLDLRRSARARVSIVIPAQQQTRQRRARTSSHSVDSSARASPAALLSSAASACARAPRSLAPGGRRSGQRAGAHGARACAPGAPRAVRAASARVGHYRVYQGILGAGAHVLQAVARGVGRLGMPRGRVRSGQVGHAAVPRAVGRAVVAGAARQRRVYLELVKAQRLQVVHLHAALHEAVVPQDVVRVVRRVRIDRLQAAVVGRGHADVHGRQLVLPRRVPRAGGGCHRVIELG